MIKPESKARAVSVEEEMNSRVFKDKKHLQNNTIDFKPIVTKEPTKDHS